MAEPRQAAGDLSTTIVAISDFIERRPGQRSSAGWHDSGAAWAGGYRGPLPVGRPSSNSISVIGSYLDRLPLAAVKAGLADRAEVWHHQHGEQERFYERDNSGIVRRGFFADSIDAPYRSSDMLGFIKAFGAPRIVCVWGLGVSDDILEACRTSTIIYNSLDVPPLRVPEELVGHFDLVLTGASWQSREVAARHPDLATAILPIGPEFASPETFFPIDCEKPYDVVYVAAAQPYKRHDILFKALQRAPRPLRALCVMGYGEMGETLRAEARALGLAIDFVGPPGVAYPEVNRLINTARIGVVCGVDDGAPAILTEYMLAGLPVVANSRLRCGLQYILPETGIVADEDAFHIAIVDALDRLADFSPRDVVMDRWIWSRSIEQLSAILSSLKRRGSNDGAGEGDAIGLDHHRSL